MANLTSAVDLGWYAPSQTLINNLTHVASNATTGVYGFIFNSSSTPDNEYGTYNWCNMPHTRAQEYVVPSDEYELVYVELIHRHHKRTPYASNSFPVESYTWECNDQGLFYYAEPFSVTASASTENFTAAPDPNAGRNASAQSYWQGTSNVAGFINPFETLATGWKGTCQFPQITAPGLDDAWQHGADLYAVYGDLLGFLPARSSNDSDNSAAASKWRDERVRYRVTNNVITSETAGMIIAGMWDLKADQQSAMPLLIQPSGVDSLEPAYTCSSSTDQFDAIQSNASNPSWEAHLVAAQSLYGDLDAISGVPTVDDTSGFHASFDHYYDNLSARQCHGKPLPCKLVNSTTQEGAQVLVNDTSDCVTQTMADEVYRFGNWEYSQIYRDAGAETLAASVGSFGVWIAELAAHLRTAVSVDGSETATIAWFHNVAHDGSVSRLLSILQVDVMVWPGMGSEVVFELWKKNQNDLASVHAKRSESGYYVRVLFGGKVLNSSNPSLGMMDMLPLETLLAYFDGLVGTNASLVVDKCSAS
ncbi:histidine acid phosphatase [Coniella lustricola]|uniref:Histidine acid phosphatase n=1 Tax=Coniella lustricola TaxID=2025994 RepID=A0A2T3AGK7_9PEZI|nr:histidine acid phosphatase [Coniella lustricola]